MTSAIVASGISKAFGDVQALHDLELDVPEGAFFVLLGPSGAGKTTTLRVIAGLEKPDSGSVHLTGVQGVNLRDHIGHQVEVNGVVRSEQEMTSASPSREADKATGTAGTPTVQTRTQLQVREMQVQSVKPTGEKCE